MVQLEIIRINFDDIWRKYSKDSGIEFVCFSFELWMFLCQLIVWLVSIVE